MKKYIIILISLAIVISGAIIAYNIISDDEAAEPLPPPTAILYNGAYYQIKETTTTVPTGSPLTFLTTDKSNTYISTTEKTDSSLYNITPGQEVFLIVKEGDQYKEAIFANFSVGSAETLDITKCFSFYSVSSSQDIKSISQVKSNNSTEVSGNIITAPESIATFYNQLLTLEKFSEDQYHEKELAEATDVEEYDRRTRNRRDLLIKTATGLEFYLECYPNFKWVYSATTQTYYKMNDSFSEWAKANLK